jgi:hypothetical protein
MQIFDAKLRNDIIFVAAVALIVCTVGAAGIVGFLFVNGQAQVNPILIGFVAYSLGTLTHLVTQSLGFNQGVNVLPVNAAPPASSITTTQSEVVSLPSLPVAPQFAGIG